MLMSEEEEMPKAVNIRSAIAVLIVTRCSKVGRACLLRGLYNFNRLISCIQVDNEVEIGIDIRTELIPTGGYTYEDGNWS